MYTRLGERLKTCSVEITNRVPLMLDGTVPVRIVNSKHTAVFNIIEDATMGFRVVVLNSLLVVELQDLANNIGTFTWNIPEMYFDYVVNFGQYNAEEESVFSDLTRFLENQIKNNISNYIFANCIPSNEGHTLIAPSVNTVDIAVTFGTTY